MSKNNYKITLEDQQNDILYKTNKSNLNITFNRVAFIFFTFFIISLIFTIHLIHLGSRKENTNNNIISKKFPSKLNRSDILDRDGNYLSKTVNSIDIGISPSKIIDEKKELLNKKANILSVIYPLGLMFIVLGSIIFGIATPSEAAGIGALGAIILAYSQNNLSKIILDKCVFESIKLTSMVFMILIGAILFSLVFRGLEGEEFIHKFLVEMPDSKFMTLFIILLIMFFLGFILDFIEITFIVIPLIGPALFTLGFDPLWIGILIALVLQTSFITPPFGFSLFYLRGVLPKNVKTTEIYKGIIPFLIIQIFLVIVVFIFPDLATALPKTLLK